MSRPILISDCDEVLLHMVSHFADWLDEEHRILFDLGQPDFRSALTFAADGGPVPEEQIWPLLDGFFRSEMHRQTPVPGALEALGRIAEIADIVILTNLGDEAHPWRVEQLAAHGITHEVVCNRGGKGEPLKAIVARHGASRSVFVDDLAVHHASVAKHSPDTIRLHMIAEPRLAAVTPPAPHAHMRIDDWPTAATWIIEQLRDRT
ncbi:HAD family hydrolase [Sphingomonas sp. GCM10030256]|uniref:HAD family hydrolase n=1 Tax=Sphingomonas sp. GCM10030256 TaxID=3273427 RepID=UPI003619D8BB